MRPGGSKDTSTEDGHPWEKHYGASESGVAYLAEAERQTSAADTEMIPVAAKESALADPVADAGTGKAEAVETATKTAAATKTAVKAVSAGKRGQEDGTARPGNRVSKPVLAAAGIAGLVLLSVPLLIAGLLPDDDNTPTRALPDPAAYADEGDPQAGFVPGMAQERQQPLPPVGLYPTPQTPPGPVGGTPAAPPEVPAGTPDPAVPEQPAQQPNDVARKAAFTALGGPGCGGSSFSRPGYYTDGNKGWSSSKGAYVGGGCDGSYFSVPMSGDRNKDGDNSAVWRFTTGDVKQGSCQVSVYVPRGDLTKVGGDPSYYTVYQSDQTSNPVGDFQIFQVREQGNWVNAGRFPVTDGRLTVKLHSRGVDWTDKGPTYAHHAAAQLKLDCSA